MRARQNQFSFSILSRLVRVSEEQPDLFPDKNVDILTDYSTRGVRLEEELPLEQKSCYSRLQ
jgi:hypothetical protein